MLVPTILEREPFDCRVLACRTSFLYVDASSCGLRVCLRKANKMETMMLVSKVSLKQMKKTKEAEELVSGVVDGTVMQQQRGTCLGQQKRSAS